MLVAVYTCRIMLAVGYTSLIMLATRLHFPNHASIAGYTSLIMLAAGYISLIMLAVGYTSLIMLASPLHFSLP